MTVVPPPPPRPVVRPLAADSWKVQFTANNQHAAELVYGRAKMEASRAPKVASTQARLF